jgi:hypothetical protein
VNRIAFKLFALALLAAGSLQALGLGGAVGTSSLHMDPIRKGGASDLRYQTLDVKFNTLKFSLLDLGKPLATGIYSGEAEGSVWWRTQKVDRKAADTRWVASAFELSYIMGSSTGADEVLSLGGGNASPSPSTTNSFWGVDADMDLVQYQFLKLPLELNVFYDAQFRSYTVSGVYDGAVGNNADFNGMSVNGYLGMGVDVGVVPGLVLSASASYDPIISTFAALYPDLMSQGYRLAGGAEYQPIGFVSAFAHYELQSTGFVGVGRTATLTDITFGGRIYFY